MKKSGKSSMPDEIVRRDYLIEVFLLIIKNVLLKEMPKGIDNEKDFINMAYDITYKKLLHIKTGGGL